MKANRHFSQGAVAVEFALVLVMLLTLVFCAIEFGRAVFVWNAAVDATRRGARMAAIAEFGDRTRVIDAMYLRLAGVPQEKVTIEYSADGSSFGQAGESGTCEGRGSCAFVRVRISGYAFTPLMPFVAASIDMPSFATTVPVEALGAT